MDIIGHRFLLTSYLQKSIRRGLIEHAQNAAKHLQESCTSTFNRRMAIIALEDIGLGNPTAVATMFEAENFIDHIPVLCASPKNRDASKLGGWAKAEVDPQFEFELGFTDTAHKANILQSNAPLPQKMAVLKSLPFPDALTILECPPAQKTALLTAHSYRITTLALAYALLLYESAGETANVVAHTLPPVPNINNIPAWAYDMHTSSGKAAIKHWQARVPELAQIPTSCVNTLLFGVEGGAVTPQAIFSFTQTIKRGAFTAHWPAELDEKILLKHVMKNLNSLHKLRAQYA